MRLQVEERRTIQVNKRLLDNGFHLAVALLHVHHHRDGHTSCHPLRSGLGQVAHQRHVTRLAGCDEVGSRHTERVAVVCVEVRGDSATTFVAEEVVERGELAFVHAVGFQLCQALANHLNEQFLCLDLTYHHISVRVAVERQLLCNPLRQRTEQFARCGSQHRLHVLAFRVVALQRSKFLVLRQHVVQLLYQHTHSGDELNKSLGDEHGTEVQSGVRTVNNHLHYLLHNIVQRHILCLYLLRNQADIRLALQCALKGDMRSRATHQADEVPVFLCRVSVALDVTNQLAVHFASGVEAERGLNHVVLQVAVDGLRAANHLNTAFLLQVILCQHAGIGVRVVAANNHDGLDT